MRWRICPELLRPVPTGYSVYVLSSMPELLPFVVRAGTARPQLRRRPDVCDACMNEDLDETSKCFRCGTRCHQCDKRDPKTGIYIKAYCESTCGFRQVQFQGDDTLHQFGRWLFNPSHRGCTALAHNMKVVILFITVNIESSSNMYGQHKRIIKLSHV